MNMTNMATRTADDDDEGRQMTMTNMAARMSNDNDEEGDEDVR